MLQDHVNAAEEDAAFTDVLLVGADGRIGGDQQDIATGIGMGIEEVITMGIDVALMQVIVPVMRLDEEVPEQIMFIAIALQEFARPV